MDSLEHDEGVPDLRADLAASSGPCLAVPLPARRSPSSQLSLSNPSAAKRVVDSLTSSASAAGKRDMGCESPPAVIWQI